MIRLYIGEKASRTHENDALEDFIATLVPRWGGSDDFITVIAYGLWNGAEIDAVALLPSAIAVIDFKDHAGHVRTAENGPWYSDSGVIKGGSKVNPLAQVRDNKRSVIDWFVEKSLLPGRNLGHISGVVLFSGPVNVEGELPPRIRSWFYVTDLERCAERLSSLASPQIRITPSDSDAIVAALGVQPYWSSRSAPHSVSMLSGPVGGQSRGDLTDRQREALDTIERFLKDPARQTLSVLGMTHSGKTTLLAEAVQSVRRLGRSPVVLVPNSRLARRLEGKFALTCSSIYTHLYGLGGGNADKPPKDKVWPLNCCSDSPRCVYLIDEAHLLGNDYFELEDGTKFGSGKLADDLFAFVNAKESGRQILFFGDPYQLPRGKPASMPLFGEYQAACGLAATSVFLSEMIEDQVRPVGLANARRLAEAIHAGDFAEFQFEIGDGFGVLTAAEASTRVVQGFRQTPAEICVIAETHARTSELNRWVRRELFGDGATEPVVAGDWLEFYSGFVASADPFGTNAGLSGGDRVEVTCPGGLGQVQRQALRGREEPVTFTTRRVGVRRADSNYTLFALQEFLVGVRPELDPDVAVAVEVWQRTQIDPEIGARPDQTVARLRYGYAATAHRAQGFDHPTCFVDARSGGGRHSEHYFRWLYTAITRASRCCWVFSFQPLDSLDEAQWAADAAQTVGNISLGAGWCFGGQGSVGDVTVPTATLVSRIQRLVRDLGWEAGPSRSSAYQEQLPLRGAGGVEATLFAAYNKSQTLTRVWATGHASVEVLVSKLAEELSSNAVEDAAGKTILDAVRSRLASRGLRIVGAHRDSDYRLSVVVRSEGAQVGQIEINHDKRGIASLIRLVKTTGPAIAGELGAVFAQAVEGH